MSAVFESPPDSLREYRSLSDMQVDARLNERQKPGAIIRYQILPQQENHHQHEVTPGVTNLHLPGTVTARGTGNSGSTGTADWRAMAKQSLTGCQALAFSWIKPTASKTMGKPLRLHCFCRTASWLSSFV